MKNYKTTTIGVILGVLITVQPILQNGEFDSAKDWINLVIGIAISALGYISKDADNDTN